MRFHILFFVLILQMGLVSSQQEEPQKTSLKLGVVGMTQGHVHQVLRRGKTGHDIEIVAFVEPNRDLAERLAKQYGYDTDLIYPTMEAMMAEARPEAVSAFNSTFEHLETVRFFAPRGVHIMVEKPLAVNWEHAQEMISLAKKYKIALLTNYETSWYGSNAKAYELIHSDEKIGPIRRIVFHTGHPGPMEIGCTIEFLDWLTDPLHNGGGALTDFGCYGANLSTWLMKGETPESVTCTTQQLKPEKYPDVDDDATIIIKYVKAQVIIQASWNWPHNVKDMEVYGTKGYVFCKNNSDMKVLENEKEGAFDIKATPLPKGNEEPFVVLRKIVKEDHKLSNYNPTSLENNTITMQILEAARLSSEQGKTILWSALYPKEE